MNAHVALWLTTLALSFDGRGTIIPFIIKHLNPEKVLLAEAEGSSAMDVFKSIPAVFLGLMLTLLQTISYGIIIFPSNDPSFPRTAGAAGISIFLFSSLIAQLVFSVASSFKGVSGLMMLEVIPFLHLLCQIIKGKMQQDQSEPAILATIVAAYAISTILTGIVFLAIALLKLGNVISYFPRHILLGCIGGIGVFLFISGFEITSGIPLSSSSDWNGLLNSSRLALLASSLSIAIFLKLLQTRIKYQLFVPIFYFFVPIVFYIVVAMSGANFEDIRDAGWLFKFQSNDQRSPFIYWTYFDFSLIDVSALLACAPTICALAFFGIIHVPLNVPALSVSTQQDNIDMNREILLHGVSNMISGLFGACQNYLVYTNSVLIYRCGGDSRTSGVMLACAIAGVFLYGETVLPYVPTVTVGAMVFHLAIDLIKEATIDTLRAGVSRLEYFTILFIMFTMTIVGFSEGIIGGLLLACVVFVFTYSQKSIIKFTYGGHELRSSVYRTHHQQRFLDSTSNQAYIIKLSGYLFFGTIHQLDDHIQSKLDDQELLQLKHIVFDFTAVNGIDFSSIESLRKLRVKFTELDIFFVICNLSGQAQKAVGRSDMVDDASQDSGKLRIFQSLQDALSWTEDHLLKEYYNREIDNSEESSIPNNRMIRDNSDATLYTGSQQHSSAIDLRSVEISPQSYILYNALSEFIGVDTFAKSPSSNYHANDLENAGLMKLDNSNIHLNRYAREVIDLGKIFARLEIESGDLWQVGDEARSFYIIESGELEMLVSEKGVPKVVQVMHSGQMVKLISNFNVQVGDVEFFALQRRGCKLVATTNCIVYELTCDKFNTLFEQNTALAFALIKKSLSGPRMESLPYCNIPFFHRK